MCTFVSDLRLPHCADYYKVTIFIENKNLKSLNVWCLICIIFCELTANFLTDSILNKKIKNGSIVSHREYDNNSFAYVFKDILEGKLKLMLVPVRGKMKSDVRILKDFF